MGPKSLGIKIGKSESEAEQMMNDFKDSYPKMAQFLVKTITESGQGSKTFPSPKQNCDDRELGHLWKPYTTSSMIWRALNRTE